MYVYAHAIWWSHSLTPFCAWLFIQWDPALERAQSTKTNFISAEFKHIARRVCSVGTSGGCGDGLMLVEIIS